MDPIDGIYFRLDDIEGRENPICRFSFHVEMFLPDSNEHSQDS